MPVRDRKYENLLQFIFGGLICLAILSAIAYKILKFFHKI